MCFFTMVLLDRDKTIGTAWALHDLYKPGDAGDFTGANAGGFSTPS